MSKGSSEKTSICIGFASAFVAQEGEPQAPWGGAPLRAAQGSRCTPRARVMWQESCRVHTVAKPSHQQVRRPVVLDLVCREGGVWVSVMAVPAAYVHADTI